MTPEPSDRSPASRRDLQAYFDAISRSMATAEFELDGTIVSANARFLQLFGYERAELLGEHHRILVPPAQAESPAYAEFWERLRAGSFQRGEFERRDRGGRSVWLQASYSPVLDEVGQPQRVVKVATEVTARKRAAANAEGQIAAIHRTQAVVEFDMRGVILTANERFLETLGYELDEVVGQHHRLFVTPLEAASTAYHEFWETLQAGTFRVGEYRRIGKGGREVWLQATYTPIADLDGRPMKVVKYATDVTDRRIYEADARGQIDAISASQAVIEFDLEGVVLQANQNFLSAFGYELEEVVGRHHRQFVDPALAASEEYAQFWSDLRGGAFKSGEFRRVGKDGREVWLQATYNPIRDLAGLPRKVVKYASDVTQQVLAQRQLDRNVSEVLEVASAAAAGDLTQTVVLEGDDAGARVGQALNSLLADLRERIAAIAASAEQLARSSEEFSVVSKQLSTSTESTSALAVSSAENAARAEEAVSKVGAGVSQMAERVSEIAESAQEAAEVAASGVTMSLNANATMSQLDRSRGEIGVVVRVINSIAQQTKLLALNATIEAARAGAAGKGFAVVASEVKELAKETATATEDITQKVGAIQVSTEAAIVDLIKISQVITRVSDLQDRIQGAVEEQAQSTEQVTASLGVAGQATAAIAGSIAEAARSAQETTAGAEVTRENSEDLARLAEDLRALTERFKVQDASFLSP